MGAMIHFGTDGWRARLDGDFTEENVARIAHAAGKLWSGQVCRSVYIGYDTRPQAVGFARIAAEVIAAMGFTARLTDRPVPAPALSWATASDPDACGALMVTGSHHPSDYLGIKLRMADGGGGLAELYDELEGMVEADPPEERGEVTSVDISTSYEAQLVSLVDGESIRSAGLTAIADPMYGAARGCLAEILRSVGVSVHEIHAKEEPGWEDLRPEPIEPWVDACERAVIGQGASIGLITDGDADRVGAVDDRGRYVHPHQIIALILDHLVRHRGATGRVVLTAASSVLPRRVAESHGCRVTIRPIGFKYLYEEVFKGDVLIAGEESGGIGIPAHLPERDAMLCCLLLCELIAQENRPLSELVDELDERYGARSFARRDLRLAPESVEYLRTLLPGLNPPEVAGMEPTTVSHLDGLRLDFADESWLLLRPGGTEPVVRVLAEAPTIEQRDALLEAGIAIAQSGASA